MGGEPGEFDGDDIDAGKAVPLEGGDLGRIREILFGEESRGNEKRLTALELRLERRLDELEENLETLREELSEGLRSLEGSTLSRARASALFGDLARQLGGE